MNEEMEVPVIQRWMGGVVFVPDQGTIALEVEDEFIIRSPTPRMTVWHRTADGRDAWDYIRDEIRWRGRPSVGLQEAEENMQKKQRENGHAARLLALAQVCVPGAHKSALENAWYLVLEGVLAGWPDAVIVGLVIEEIKKTMTCPHPLEARRLELEGGGNGDDVRQVVTCCICGVEMNEQECEQEVEDVAAIDF